MSQEQPSQSEYFGFSEDWAVGEIAEIVTETALMPAEIPFEVLGDIAGGFFEGFSDSK